MNLDAQQLMAVGLVVAVTAVLLIMLFVKRNNSR